MSMLPNPLVIRFGRLGDTILLQPFLQKLHQRYGRPCHLLALGDWPSALYSAQPEVAGFIPLRTQSGPLWLSPRRVATTIALRTWRQSPVYVCEPEYRTRTKIRPMLALAGISPERCSFIEDLASVEYEHWVDWLWRFADATPPAFEGVPLAPSLPGLPAPQLQVSAAEQADAAAWLHTRGIHDAPLVLLQPANKRTMRWNGVRKAEDDDKSWPIERWAAVARTVAAEMPQAQVMFCGSAAELVYLDAIVAASAGASSRIAAAALPLSRLKALLAHAHSMISVDTGPAHLAAAVGCPLVVLMGARTPHLWKPRSASGSAVALLGGLPDVQRVDQLPVEQVIDTWRKLPLGVAQPPVLEPCA
jgi:ADP-heptose:LPS heptosyltransferase